jgi:hypothetical protein
VEERHVIEYLDIARLELDDKLVLDGREVHGINSFSLLLWHDGDIWVVRRERRSSQWAARVAEPRAVLVEVEQ